MTPRGRFWLFWGVCIPLRTAWAALCVVAATQRLEWLNYGIASLMLVNTLHWLTVLWRAFRGRYTEGGFGGPVWWGHVRVVHIALWMVACVATFAQQVWAGWWMVADVAIGAIAGFLYHGFEIEV